MGGQKQNPQEADYTPAQEPIALTAGARGRMSSLLTILALLLILFCGADLARALINRYLDLAETEVALRVSDGDGTPTLNASEAGPIEDLSRPHGLLPVSASSDIVPHYPTFRAHWYSNTSVHLPDSLC